MQKLEMTASGKKLHAYYLRTGQLLLAKRVKELDLAMVRWTLNVDNLIRPPEYWDSVNSIVNDREVGGYHG